jgi:hypothetical protein
MGVCVCGVCVRVMVVVVMVVVVRCPCDTTFRVHDSLMRHRVGGGGDATDGTLAAR